MSGHTIKGQPKEAIHESWSLCGIINDSPQPSFLDMIRQLKLWECTNESGGEHT